NATSQRTRRRRSLANSQPISLSNAFAPCHAFEIIFQRILAQVQLGQRQAVFLYGVRQLRQLQRQIENAQAAVVLDHETVGAEFGLQHLRRPGGVRTAETDVPAVLLLKRLQAFFLKQRAVVNDADVVGKLRDL